MDVFRLRDSVIDDYAEYVSSFVVIREQRFREFIDQSLTDQALWPQPLIQMNPCFEAGGRHCTAKGIPKQPGHKQGESECFQRA